MKYRILKDGAEINTIVSDEDFVAAYCAENGYTWELIAEPDPEPVDPVPTEEDDTAALLVDHEYRLTLLELGLTE